MFTDLIYSVTSFWKNGIWEELQVIYWCKEEIWIGAVLVVWDMWYNIDAWQLMPKTMFSRCLLAHRKINHIKDASLFHFMIFLILSLFRLLQHNSTDWVAYKQWKCIFHSSGGQEAQGQSTSMMVCSSEDLLLGCRLLVLLSHGRRGGVSLGPLLWRC